MVGVGRNSTADDPGLCSTVRWLLGDSARRSRGPNVRNSDGAG